MNLTKSDHKKDWMKSTSLIPEFINKTKLKKDLKYVLTREVNPAIIYARERFIAFTHKENAKHHKSIFYRVEDKQDAISSTSVPVRNSSIETSRILEKSQSPPNNYLKEEQSYFMLGKTNLSRGSTSSSNPNLIARKDRKQFSLKSNSNSISKTSLYRGKPVSLPPMSPPRNLKIENAAIVAKKKIILSEMSLNAQSAKTRLRLSQLFRKIYYAIRLVKVLSENIAKPIEEGWERGEHQLNVTDLSKFMQVGKKSKGPTLTNIAMFQSSTINIPKTMKRSSKNDEYIGWLTPSARTILKKNESERTVSEVSDLFHYCSAMKSLRRFPVSVQLEFLKCSRYEKWTAGRVIVKEGDRPMYFFIILDGEVEMYTRDDLYIKNIVQERKIELEMMSQTTQDETIAEINRTAVRSLGTLNSGESFGDSSFREKSKRTATIKTMRVSEFLVIDMENYERIVGLVASFTGSDDTQQKLETFKRTCKLFGSINFETTALLRHCEMRKYAPNSALLTEGENSGHIWFVLEGDCIIYKILNVLVEKDENGVVIETILPLRYQQMSKTYSFKTITLEQLVKDGSVYVKRDSMYTISHRLFEIGTAGAGSHFGEAHSHVKGLGETMMKPENNNTSIRKYAIGNEKDFIGTDYDPCSISLVAKNRVELVGIKKLDFYKFATLDTWKLLAIHKVNRASLPEILREYQHQLDYQDQPIRANIMKRLEKEKKPKRFL